MENNETTYEMRDYASAPLQVVDQSTTSYPPGVICVLKGPCMDYLNPTRNDRLYTHDLIEEKIINDPTYKEMLATKTFLGEPDHPIDNRAAVTFPMVSHAIREVWDEPSLGQYWCIVDILDTIQGRNLKAIIDYGAQLGISSRGYGRTIMSKGVPIADKSTYKFITFDLVHLPGVKAARLTPVSPDATPVSESVETNDSDIFYENLESLVTNLNKTTLQEGRNLIPVLEYLQGNNDERAAKICENLQIKIKELDESTADNQSNTPQDLVTAYNRIAELESELSLRESKIKELTDSNEFLSERLNTVNATNSGLLSKLSSIENKYNESINSIKVPEIDNNDNEELNSLRESLESKTEELRTLNSNYTSLRLNNDNLDRDYHKVLSQNEALTQKVDDLTSYNEDLIHNYIVVRGKSLGLSESVINSKIDFTKYNESDNFDLIDNDLRRLMSSNANMYGTRRGTSSMRLIGKSQIVPNKDNPLIESVNSGKDDDLELIKSIRALSN